MKKWIVAILVFVLFCLSSVYIFIPSPIRISNSINIQSSLDGTLRTIRNPGIWKKFSNNRIQSGAPLFNGVNIVADSAKDEPVDGKILLVPMRADSTVLIWEYVMKKSGGPIGRVKDYFRGVAIKENMDLTVHKIKQLNEDIKQMYGINIVAKSTVDTLMVATKFITKQYPNYAEIYSKVDELKKYIADNDASVAGYPMLNITKFDTNYKCMVAVPVNHIIGDQGKIFFVRMIPGKFLTAEIIGGPGTIKNAQDMMNLYFQDFKRTSMAVPYEYMVTDRIKEKDTTKWVTRIYAPVY